MNKRQKTNAIIADNGDHLEIDISTPKFPDAVMLIDKPDWDRIKLSLTGRISAWNPTDKKPYATTYINGKKLFIHRLILPADDHVDHINGNGGDNRRENLRACTCAENQMNRPKSKRNKSGFKGVCFHVRSKKWQSRIGVARKIIDLGYFDAPEEAYAAYCEASIKYHGEFGRVA